MTRYLRILAAVLVLTALAPAILGRPDLICVEASGKVSYGCNDLVPDDMNVHLALPVTLGSFLQDCGFCHDYVIGQVVTQSFQTLALPVAQVGVHLLVLAKRLSMLQPQSFPVGIADNSGSTPPLKC
jgi:hypothetical protein